MIGGASWTWWLGFHAAVVALLSIDWLLQGRRGDSPPSPKAAWVWTAVLALAAASFAGWIAIAQGHVRALEFYGAAAHIWQASHVVGAPPKYCNARTCAPNQSPAPCEKVASACV